MATNQQLTDSFHRLSSDPAVDMDDTTGSNGGSAKERFSGESDNTGDDQEVDSDHTIARSDTARVDGTGISGGTGDTDISQAGGRSQY